MHRVERVADLERDLRDRLGREPLAALERRAQHLGQRLALDELHHEVDVAGVLAERVDLDEVLVVERREDAGLGAEPLDEIAIATRGRSAAP